MFAADTLFDKALGASGMDKGYAIQGRIEELAKNWKIKRTSTTLQLPMENPRQAVRDFKKAQLEDVECFTKTVDRRQVISTPSASCAFRTRSNRAMPPC
jgi:hypothetical protein